VLGFIEREEGALGVAQRIFIHIGQADGRDYVVAHVADFVEEPLLVVLAQGRELALRLA